MRQRESNTAITGYLLAFVICEAFAIVMCFVRMGGYLAASLGNAASAVMHGMAIALFARRNRRFKTFFIIGSALDIILAIEYMVARLGVAALLPSVKHMLDGLFGVVSVVLAVIMLVFWLRYFKSSVRLKVYLKGGKFDGLRATVDRQKKQARPRLKAVPAKKPAKKPPAKKSAGGLSRDDFEVL